MRALRLPFKTLALTLLLAAAPALAGDLPAQWQNGNTTYHKAAESTYKLLWMRVTTAALYVPPQTTPPTGDIMDPSYPKLLAIDYGVGVSRERFESMARDTLAEHWPDSVLQKHAAAIDQFCDWLRDVQKGDRYTLNWQPGKGLALALNDTPAGTIADTDASQVILSIWLGRAAISESQRDELLGQWRSRIEREQAVIQASR